MTENTSDLTIRTDWLSELAELVNAHSEKAETDAEKELIYRVAETIKDSVEFED